MNAIELLKEQHREIESLFTRFDTMRDPVPRRQIFERIADALAVHAAIEERHFYPAVKERQTEQQTEELLLASVEEHLAIKRVIVDLLALDGADESFEAKVRVLRSNVEHHVGEEEAELFPKAEKLFDERALAALTDAMEDTWADLLRTGDARGAVPWDTEKAAQV